MDRACQVCPVFKSPLKQILLLILGYSNTIWLIDRLRCQLTLHRPYALTHFNWQGVCVHTQFLDKREYWVCSWMSFVYSSFPEKEDVIPRCKSLRTDIPSMLPIILVCLTHPTIQGHWPRNTADWMCKDHRKKGKVLPANRPEKYTHTTGKALLRQGLLSKTTPEAD